MTQLAVIENSRDLFVLIGICGGLLLGLLGILGGVISGMYHTRARERTKREIAAYIAEGSMTPEQGEKLLKADMPAWQKGEGIWGGFTKR